MIKKIIIPVCGNEVAPRFDLATEVLVIIISENNEIEEKRTVVLSQASAEKLCHLILTENIQTLICGAIEDEYYQFLKWKNVVLFDSVSGPWEIAFARYLENSLNHGDIFFQRMVEGKDV